MSVYVGFKVGKAKERKAYVSEYYCGGCGHPVSDHDSYCPECGGAFRKEDATERTCTMNRFEDIFGCSECGQIAHVFTKPNYCPSCGSKVIDHER